MILQGNDRFGEAISLDNGTIAIGAPGKTTNVGAVYIFTEVALALGPKKIKLMAAIPIIQ